MSAPPGASPRSVSSTPSSPSSPLPASPGSKPPSYTTPPPQRRNPIVRFILSTLSFLLSQWMLIGMGIFVILAWLFPSVGKRGGAVASQWTITYAAVIVIFLISGLSLPFDKLVKHARNIRLHAVVQIMSFLFTPAIFFAIACAAKTNSNIEVATLVGLVATGCLPTTINSNVVMTRQAGGDEAATTVSVTLGNFLGPFITPLLITRLYLPAVAEFHPWIPSDALDDLPALYRSVMMQMGLTVFVPLAVGQVIRAIWTKQVAWVLTTFRLAKFGSVCLLLLVWATFCNAFASQSLQTLNTPSIIFNIFVNLALCIFFTVLSFFIARPPLFLNRLSPRIFKRVDKREAIAICFCAPAKTQALGIPLITAMYHAESDQVRSAIQVPMVLYTAEQILVGQVMVWLFKRWLKQGEEGEGLEVDAGEGNVAEVDEGDQGVAERGLGKMVSRGGELGEEREEVRAEGRGHELQVVHSLDKD